MTFNNSLANPGGNMIRKTSATKIRLNSESGITTNNKFNSAGGLGNHPFSLSRKVSEFNSKRDLELEHLRERQPESEHSQSEFSKDSLNGSFKHPLELHESDYNPATSIEEESSVKPKKKLTIAEILA